MSAVSTGANAVAATNPPFNREQPLSQLVNHPGQRAGLFVRFAYKLGGRYFEPVEPIDASARGDVVMREVNHTWKLATATTKAWDMIHHLLYKPVILFGSISSVSNLSSRKSTIVPPTHMISHQFMVADIEPGRPGRELVFSSFDRSVELTTALDRPALLRPVGCFAESYPDVVTGSMAIKFVVVALEVQKRALLRLIVCALLVSVVVGVVVGVATKSVQAGFGCFGGLGVVVSIALAVVLEMHK
ncbi:hypothetical protein PG996_006483 [Apiospora saccharicola]|uniref:Transmembrane protein n=1 Tax=Apiospora saccharicola TaxID=335842 RepID=A0ABR1VPG0_9PEZI